MRLRLTILLLLLRFVGFAQLDPGMIGVLYPTTITVAVTWDPTHAESHMTFTNANATVQEAANAQGSTQSTAGYLINALSGVKTYAEFKIENLGSGTNNYIDIGMMHTVVSSGMGGGMSGSMGVSAAAVCLEQTGTSSHVYYQSGGGGTNWGSTFAAGDVVAIGLDGINGNVYLGKASGGSTTWWSASGASGGDPTSGATGTGKLNVSGALSGTYFFAITIFGPTTSAKITMLTANTMVGAKPAGYNYAQ